MKTLLFYDTETTGLPEWGEPSDGANQPHIVQIAAILTGEDFNEISSVDLIIKPDGWVIPPEMSEIHGITHEMAMEVGVPELDAVMIMVHMWKQAYERVAYNETFDARITRICLKRNGLSDLCDQWKEGRAKCAMRMFQSFPGSPGGRYSKLKAAYAFFNDGEEHGDQHSALGDVRALINVYKNLTTKVEAKAS